MGQKVTDQVAEMRSLPAGIDQRSPARHPDWLGPDDLALKIEEISEATNWEIPIQLKLGAARVYDDVRMAAKTDPDMHLYRRHGRRHRCGPASRDRRDRRARHRRDPPGEKSARRRRQDRRDLAWSMPAASGTAATCRQGAWRWVPTPWPSATPSLMALNCNKDIPEADYEEEMGVEAGYCYHCHTGRCPVGVATQDPKLRAEASIPTPRRSVSTTSSTASPSSAR